MLNICFKASEVLHQLVCVERYQPDICALTPFCLPRQLKGDSWHQHEGEESTLGAVALSGPGGGAPEGGEEVCHCTQWWTIDRERWRFPDSLRQTVSTCCLTLL